MILGIQKMVSHLTQVIYAGSILAQSYFYLDQVKNKKLPIAITHNLFYQLFPLFFTGQGKKTDKDDKNCFT